MRTFVGVLLAPALLSAVPSVPLAAQIDWGPRARSILMEIPLIDGHNDIPDAIRERGGIDMVAFETGDHRLMTDIPRLREGVVGAQFWAAYVPIEAIHGGTRPAAYALEQIDVILRLCRKYPKAMALARNTTDIERNFRSKKVSCLIGIEGGHAIENSLGALRAFYELGVRYMTLTHNETLDWADAAMDSARHDGLTAFGEEVVREMNRLGMLVDLSHVSDATMMDALRVARAPVIFSHSSARAIAHHRRNVPDSILVRVARNRGVVMVNFNPPFVSEDRRLYEMRRDSVIAAMRAGGVDSLVRRDTLRAWNERGPVATLAQVVDHIEHIRRVAGADYVGLGSDFDGISTTPTGLEDVSKFPEIIEELLRRRWSEVDIKKLAGGNVLRVLSEAEQVAARLRAAPN
jgi:membrane dipeptidase